MAHKITQVPNSQNLEVNLRSLSDTMLDGTPCNLTISLIYREVNFSKEKSDIDGNKVSKLGQPINNNPDRIKTSGGSR